MNAPLPRRGRACSHSVRKIVACVGGDVTVGITLSALAQASRVRSPGPMTAPIRSLALYSLGLAGAVGYGTYCNPISVGLWACTFWPLNGANVNCAPGAYSSGLCAECASVRCVLLCVRVHALRTILTCVTSICFVCNCICIPVHIGAALVCRWLWGALHRVHVGVRGGRVRARLLSRGSGRVRRVHQRRLRRVRVAQRYGLHRDEQLPLGFRHCTLRVLGQSAVRLQRCERERRAGPRLRGQRLRGDGRLLHVGPAHAGT